MTICKEAAILLEHFGGRVGKILDLGAADGIGASVSLPLIEAGWQAVCVEANPYSFVKLMELHGKNPRVTLLNCIVGSMAGWTRFHACHADPALSTISEELVARGCGRENSTAFHGFAARASGIIGSFGPFDVVSIDLEGESIAVMSNLVTYAKPEVLVVEYFAPDVMHRDEPATILDIAQGYREIARTGENLVLCRT
jgi:FkbM family methyltransferase